MRNYSRGLGFARALPSHGALTAVGVDDGCNESVLIPVECRRG